jgi:thiosulfate/3-mercaptopyruvate sulfurtransferase
MDKYLINVDQLAACYQRDNVLVIDCRYSLADTLQGEALYRQAHIPGAHYLHLDRELSGSKSLHGGRHPLPEVSQLEILFSNLGISASSHVIAYDDSRFGFAARLWWLLRYLGHEKVQLLDGGFNAWREQGLAVARTVPQRSVQVFKASPRPELVVDINEVKTVPHMSSSVLIDSREAKRFLGEEEPIDPVAGHINGAKNYPWQQVTDERGFFLGEDRQKSRWGDVLGQQELVVYCGSGVTACVNLLSLAIVGREDAKLYAGSWSDWCSYL